MSKQVALQVSAQLAPGEGQSVAVVFCSAGQSALVQHVVLPMHRLPQTTWLPGQEHFPPGPEQVSVAILQSAVVQHSVDGMHILFALQKVCPVGQLQEPPGPEQLPPPTQSAFVQHCP